MKKFLQKFLSFALRNKISINVWLLWNLPLRAHEKENDNLQQQRQQKATQTLVVQNMDSAIHSGLNHYPEDKYYGNQLHYPVNRDLSGGLSAIHPVLGNKFSVTQVLKQLATRHLWYYNQTPYDYNAKLCTIRPITSTSTSQTL